MNRLPRERKRHGNVVDFKSEMQNGQERETPDSSDLYFRRLFRPVFVFLALTGNTADVDVFLEKDKPNSTMIKMLKVVLILYRLLIFVIVITTLCRLIAGVVLLDSTHLTYSVINLAWCCHCLLNMVLITKMEHKKYGSLHKVMNLWDAKLVPAFSSTGMEFDVKCLKRKQLAVIICAVIIMALNTTGIVVLASGVVSPKMAEFFSSPFSKNTLTMTFHVASMISLAMVWFGPFVIQLTSCILIKNVFRSYLKIWNMSVQTTEHAKDPGHCTRFRHLHLDICKLVEELDEDFSLFYAATFVTGTFIACFCLYQLLNGVSYPINLVMYVFWLITIMGLIVIVFGFAAYVHEAAHAPLNAIYYLDVVGIDVETSAQLNLFLSKLTGTQVGFTTLGLLTITKEFLLTILGVFLTYFFLLYSL